MVKKVLSYEQEAILPARCMFRIKNGVLVIRGHENTVMDIRMHA